MAERSQPPGNYLLSKCCCHNANRSKRTKSYKLFVLGFTFLIYTMYHMSRKPFSIVKGRLNQNCTKLDEKHHMNHSSAHWCDWAPFDQSNYLALLGALDSCFLFAYAFAMFISGYFAERSNLRYYLTGGMTLSSISVFCFGLGYWTNIHNFYYYAGVMFFGGMVQTSGWPAVVTCVGNWFGKSKRGVIFGLWNAHTSAGNILGSVIASSFVESDWGLSFAIPAVVMFAVAILVFFFLPPYPEDIDCDLPNHTDSQQETVPNSPDVSDSADENSPMVSSGRSRSSTRTEAISILGTLKIPGVVEFAACLLFAKLVSYTFLYWLPRYIESSDQFDTSDAGDLSTIFDFGGILGGVLAGLVSDMTGGSAAICIVMLLCSIPMLYAHLFFISFNLAQKCALLFFTGAFVNGPYALITTAVSAELGTSSTLQSNAKALSTVTAIIDGTGSFGAAVGPLLTGFLVSGGWSHVFYMLMTSQFLAALFVVRIAIKEIKRYYERFSCRDSCFSAILPCYWKSSVEINSQKSS